MSDLAPLVLAFVAGGLLGLGFFGGLWWTVNKTVSSRRPASWMLVSMVVRLTVVVAGFSLVSGGQAGRVLSCLFGFITARFIVTRLTVPAGTSEGRHAPEP